MNNSGQHFLDKILICLNHILRENYNDADCRTSEYTKSVNTYLKTSEKTPASKCKSHLSKYNVRLLFVYIDLRHMNIQ